MGRNTQAFHPPMKSILATTCVALFATGCASTPPPATSPASPSAAPPGPVAADSFELASFTRGQPACFLVTDRTGKPVIRAGGARCAERFSPCSTFKIPNSIIGLETGVVRDADTVIPWDQQKYPKQDWWPESWTDRVHDLRSAFKYSFVPYYRALATRVGAEAMQRYVHQFHYGNEDIGSSLDAFWLDGTIRMVPPTNRSVSFAPSTTSSWVFPSGPHASSRTSSCTSVRVIAL